MTNIPSTVILLIVVWCGAQTLLVVSLLTNHTNGIIASGFQTIMFFVGLLWVVDKKIAEKNNKKSEAFV